MFELENEKMDSMLNYISGICNRTEFISKLTSVDVYRSTLKLDIQV